MFKKQNNDTDAESRQRDLRRQATHNNTRRCTACGVLCLGALLCLFTEQLAANPEGGQVSAGQATITSPNPNTTQITQTSNKAVIDWQTFNIKPGETTQFIQPSKSAIALNRINPTNGISNISGNLTANGQIWLINPAGIIFSATARVDAAGLVATTANISNNDFMTGNYHFIQSPDWNGSIINNGTLTLSDNGMAALVAPGVENNGVIQANLGQVILAAGKEYTIDFYGDQLIQFGMNATLTAPPTGNTARAAVNNTGQIIADGGKVLIMAKTAENVLDRAINMSGYIQANTVVQQGGEIILTGDQGAVQVSGKIVANGSNSQQKGGKVRITGEQVELASTAIIDTSGSAGGGEILIGGDYQGKNPSISNAANTFIATNATLTSDATTFGNGGKIIVWADNAAVFYGHISAQGGQQGGNGGFVETSGKNYLEAMGSVNASAPLGNAGQWLLDPSNITISSSATANGSFDGGNPDTFTTSANTAIANVGTINAALDGGTSVTILTTPGGTQAGNITLASGAGNEINKTTGGDATLTLDAVGSITLNNTITSTSNALNVTLIAGNAITINNNITTNGGNFSSTSVNATTLASTIDSGSGTFTANVNTDGAGANNFTMNAGSAITTTNNTASAVAILVNTAAGGTGAAALRDITTGSSGTLTVTTDTGNNTTGGTITTPAGALTVGNLAMSTPSSMTLTGAINASGTIALNVNTDGVGAQAFSMSAGSTIATTDTSANAIAIYVNAATGGTGTAALRSMSTGSGGTITVATDTGSNITGGDITWAAGAAESLDVGTGTITLSNPQITGTNIGATGTANIRTSAGTLNATTGSSGIFITNLGTGTLNLDTVNTTGGLTLTSTSSTGITNSGTITVTGTTNITAGATQDVTLNSATNNFGTVTITSGNNVTLTDTDALVLGASTISGALNLTTNGAITQSAAVTVAGTTTLDAGSSNNITLTTATNDFNTVSTTNGNNVSLRDANALDLGASTINGTLAITAAGSVTNSGDLVVSGATTIAAGATNDITLNSAGNNFSTIGITTGNNVTLVDTDALTLSASTISGDFNVTTNGAITQSGTINASVAGKTTTLSAGAVNDITLDNTANNFSTVAISNTNNASIRDTTALILGTSNVNGTLTVTSDNGITQSGAISGNTLNAKTLNNTGAAITLDNATNEFSSVNLQARNAGDTSYDTGAISYRDASGFDINLIGTASTIDLTAGNDITQSGSITGTTLTVKTLNNSGAAITLNNAANAVTTIDLQARNATDTTNAVGAIDYQDTNAIVVSAINTGGTLQLTTGGSITQTGALTVAGTPTFTITAATSDILLASAANDFDTTPIFATSGAGTIRDIALRNTSVSATVPILPTGLRNLTLIFDNAALTLPALTLTGTLNVTANGNIMQSGELNITGTTTLAAGATNNITLDNSNNNFSTVTITSGNNITLHDLGAVNLGASTINNNLTIVGGGAIDLAASTVGGNLDVSTSTGAITDSGALSITGNTTLATNTASSITLNSAANDFIGSVSVTSANNVSLTDTNAIDLDASTINGTLSVTANGNITQSGTLAVTGTTTLAAGAANDITLNDTNNNFGTIAITNANNVTLADSNALNIGTSTVSGNLTITAGGALADSGNIVVSGILDATSMGGITFNSAGNQFTQATLNNSGSGNIQLVSSIPLTITGFSQSSGGTVTLTDTGTLTIANGVTINSHDAALSITATDLDLNATGALNSGTATTTITQNMASGSIGLGNTAGTMTISGAELQRMTANNLILVAPTDGQIIVDDISAANSANVTTTTLTATAGTLGSVSFLNNPSTFNALTVNTDNTVSVGDGVTVNTSNSALSITAADLELNTSGALNSGTATTTITQNTASGSIGLGNTPGTMTISGAELQRITASILSLVAPTNGQIIVDGISSANSANITTTTLTATAGTLGSIIFQNAASIFNALTATADNGITVASGAPITTTVGNLTLVGGAGASGNISLTDNLTSNGSMSLSAIADGIILNAAITLTGNNVTLGSAINGAYDLIVNAGTGAATFQGIVGSTTALASLDITGTTAINTTAISTTGTQTYHNAVTLGANTALTTVNNNINFASTIDRDTTSRNLSLSTGSGDILLSGNIGSGANGALGNITLTNTGTTTLSGTVNVSGLTTNTGTFTSTGTISTNGGNANLTTTTTDNSARLLTIGSGGIVTAGGSIIANAANPTQNVAALIINGVLNTNGGAGQGTLTIGAGTELNAAPSLGSGNITLQGNGLNLTLGTLSFSYPIAFTANGNITINGSVTANGNVSFVANNVTGTIHVGSLTLGTNYANLFGTIGGYSNNLALYDVTFLEPLTIGTHFFNGVDMAVSQAINTINVENIFPTALTNNAVQLNMFNLSDTQSTEQGSGNNSKEDCVNIDPLISVCAFH